MLLLCYKMKYLSPDCVYETAFLALSRTFSHWVKIFFKKLFVFLSMIYKMLWFVMELGVTSFVHIRMAVWPLVPPPDR